MFYRKVYFVSPIFILFVSLSAMADSTLSNGADINMNGSLGSIVHPLILICID